MKQRTIILVVEDERIVAEDIQRSLGNIGYTVSDVVSSGIEALKHIEEVRPHLVLMDIVIRGEMNGIETAETIRSQFDIPVVYLTAYADESTLEKAKVTEPFGYILKPFNDRELQSTIEMALYKHRMEKKLRESEAWFSTTLKSIGDGLIATDRHGRVMFMNSVSESLTGWHQIGAIGRPLGEVFRVIDKGTGMLIESPVTRILSGISVKGLGGQSILLAKNGREIPIDDSVAPIRNERGDVVGVVLIFKDITERKKAQEKLTKSENEKAIILSSVLEVVTFQDRDLKIIWANKAACDYVALSADALMGRFCYEVFQHRSEPCVGCPVKHAIETGTPDELEIKSADGRVWIVRGYPVRDGIGQIIGAVEVRLEITERRRAQEALRLSEERYRGLFETMSQGVIYYDVNKKVIGCNPAAETIMNITEQEMIGRHPWTICSQIIKEDGTPFPIEEHPAVVCLNTGRSVSNVILGVVTTEGVRRWLLISAAPVFNDSERHPSLVFTTFTDITRTKEVEFALKERNIQLNSLNAIARSVSGTLDLKMIMDKALGELIGLAKFFSGAMFLFDEKRSFAEVEVHREVPSKALDLLTRLHKEKSFYRRSLLRGMIKWFSVEELMEDVEVQYRLDHSPQPDMYCLVVPIKVSNRVVGSLNLFGTEKYIPPEMEFDFFSNIGSHIGLALKNARLYEETRKTLEQLKITQKKLVESEKLAGLGKLAGNVVHEIGNPLAAITNSIQVLQKRVKLEGRMKELMDIIGWETERLNRSVDTLREFSKPRHLKFIESDIKEVIKKAILVLSQDFELLWGRKIIKKFSPQLPSVWIDPDALEQVVINLIKNGLQATREEGVVEVHLKCTGRKAKKRVQIIVKDDGPGVAKEVLNHIFEPYFSTKARGMGLGMHIVKQIVESHHGTIRIKSEENQGTMVTVEIPVERNDDGQYIDR